MKRTRDYFFELPEELIAQYPADRRGTSRLLILDRSTGALTHTRIEEIVDALPAGGLLVVNDSRVRKARIYGETDFSGKVELLFLEAVGSRSTWKVMSSKSKRQKVGRSYQLPGGVHARISADEGDTKILETDAPLNEEYFDSYGHMPLPPYIRREDELSDADRYQTVYAEKHGSVAAPTAGLHFTDEIMDRLRAKGVRIVPVTLHVGLGTFLPIRVEHIDDHRMHTEQYEISEEAAGLINDQLKAGGPITAVGTTSVRTLESAYDDTTGTVRSGIRSTDLFITPGYTFRVAGSLLTNFHTPESTLLILVSAFAGKELIFKAYEEAIRERYRFFSYGDAMLIT